MKKTAMILAAVLAAANLSAGELEGLRSGAGELKGLRVPEVPGTTVEEIRPAAVTGEKTFINPKIYITPVTENWKDTMLVKFRKGVGVEEMRALLVWAGLDCKVWADNGAGLLARVDIADALAPRRALLLVEYASVEAVQVNRTVYAALQSSPKSAAAAEGPEFFKLTQPVFQYGAVLPGVFSYSNSVIFYRDAATAGDAGKYAADKFEKHGRRVLKATPQALNSHYLLSITFSGKPVQLYKASGDGFASVAEARAKADSLVAEYSAAGYTLLELQATEAFGRSLYIIIFARF